MIIAGLLVFVVGSLVMIAFIGFTTTRRWHDKHHVNRTELMCDHCRERFTQGGAPPLRVLGDPRR